MLIRPSAVVVLVDIVKDLRKYAAYLFDTKSLRSDDNITKISEGAIQAAKQIRGPGREPAIILHGVTKRSGTGYIGHLLWLHPDLCQYPNQVWEIPFLALTDDIQQMQRHFFRIYEQNVGKIGENGDGSLRCDTGEIFAS
jgi:hypothetical protein